MSPTFVYLIFNDTPIQKLGHIPPLVFTQLSMWRNPLHFRVIEGYPCLSPALQPQTPKVVIFGCWAQAPRRVC